MILNYNLLILRLNKKKGINESEFKELFDRNFESIRNYIYYRSGNEEAASDIVQEAFTKLWERRSGVELSTAISLLYTIARNLHNTQYKRDARFFEFQKVEANNSQFTENEFEYEELKRNYQTALTKMPVKQREVFLLNRMDELTYKEIAVRLELSVKAIEKRMTLAIKFLREELNFHK